MVVVVLSVQKLFARILNGLRWLLVVGLSCIIRSWLSTGALFLKDGYVAHRTGHRLRIVLIVYLTRAHSYIIVKLLLKPDPDTFLMKLMLARRRHD